MSQTKDSIILNFKKQNSKIVYNFDKLKGSNFVKKINESNFRKCIIFVIKTF